MRRINVSLDTLDPDKFRAITRWGIARPGAGRHRRRAGRRPEVKINAVALKDVNDDEFAAPDRMGAWPRHGSDPDRGHAAGRDRRGPRSTNICRCRWCARGSPSATTLDDLDYRTGGPARYVRVAETGGRLGFITPLTHNFCESCNRVRLTCTGTLYMCLGQEDAADLRDAAARLGARRSALTPPSTRRSRASPRATISSSTAATSGRRWRGT